MKKYQFCFIISTSELRCALELRCRAHGKNSLLLHQRLFSRTLFQKYNFSHFQYPSPAAADYSPKYKHQVNENLSVVSILPF
mmetsp:Transcript_3172/g.4670  ORF Transcript_3172/g.4670 Transcript_3172/m.4670 type:complete len:82 (-) Transcript_3172:357-602(-)